MNLKERLIKMINNIEDEAVLIKIYTVVITFVKNIERNSKE